MTLRNAGRVFVTGATGFLGMRTVAALLEAGLEVTALVRQDQAEKLANFGDVVKIVYGDVWNKGSLKGRARGHGTVMHLIGSTHANPARGYTFHQINLVSARNVATMAVGDGVPRMILMSTVIRPLAVPGEYVRSKREAEEYVRKTGLQWTIVRAPALYPGYRHQIFMNALSAFGGLIPFRWIIGRALPLPVDIAARGLAQIAANPENYQERIVYAALLRRLARQSRTRHPLIYARSPSSTNSENDDEPPFGWLPPS